MTPLPAGNRNGTYAGVPAASLLPAGMTGGRRTIWSAGR